MRTPKDLYIVICLVLVLFVCLVSMVVTRPLKKSDAYSVGKFVIPESIEAK